MNKRKTPVNAPTVTLKVNAVVQIFLYRRSTSVILARGCRTKNPGLFALNSFDA